MDLPQISLEKEVISNVNTALDKEWLVTNGLGGYSSSTILGVNTRKYHGLLIASLNPPVKRWVMLSKLDETLQVGNKNYDLGANDFGDVMYPRGYFFLSKFMIAPFPTFRYDVQGTSLQKTLFMPYKRNATITLYEVNNQLDKNVNLLISPLVNSRHIYSTTDKNKIDWRFIEKHQQNKVTIDTSDSFSSLILSSSKNGFFVEESWWVDKLFFRVDASRGESSTDDLFRPGFFKFSVNPKEINKFYVLAVAGTNSEETENLFSSFDKDLEDINKLYTEELKRRKNLLKLFQKQNANIMPDDWLKWLIQAADSFIAYRASTGRMSVIAGYNWFDDWGRDALISLPGLTLVTGRFDYAQEILLTFERYCNKGIIPNRFSDKAGDIPLYNTVDATLWFFNAVFQYLKYTGDFSFVEEKLWKTLKDIIDYHVRGTIFGIHMDLDCLIAHGPQLTWMDASTIDGFVTPRDGKAVEIQALWFNALKIMQLLANRFNDLDNEEKYSNMAKKAAESFQTKFWNPKAGYLYDVINDDTFDSSLRPNQVIAVSLDFPILDQTKRERVVNVIRGQLWGNYGLKTLPETDSRYVGKYLGAWKHRDIAYHNGTVWAWLLGPFTTAFLKTKSHEESWRNFAFKNFLKPLFMNQLSKAGLGTISEIFDGDVPHSPRGCIAQAWSVAEPLRAYVEDIALIRPKHEQELLNYM